MQKTLSVIDLSTIRQNAKVVKKLIKDKFFFAVVKADAYGHGDVEVAREILDIADGFCVAITEEGARLRIGGIDKPILVLCPPLDNADVQACKYYSLTPTVVDEKSAKLIKGLPCHIKINTGMNRYGVSPWQLNSVLSLLNRNQVKGVYTHIYMPTNEQICEKQYSIFAPIAQTIKRLEPNALVHMCASGGILRGGKYLFDGVRAGILLYGYAPNGFECNEVHPALKVYARRSCSVSPVGDGVGYANADERYEKLFTYRLGYADGFMRGVPLGEKDLCMDAFISKEDRELFPVMENADEYAKKCGTISYEVLTSVTKRSERIYEKRAQIQI